MLNICKGRGYVYSIQYHIVWCVKYRHKILYPKIETKLIEILQKIATDNNFSIIKVNTNFDYIHLLIECTPQHYIPSMLKALKGVSASLIAYVSVWRKSKAKTLGCTLMEKLYKK